MSSDFYTEMCLVSLLLLYSVISLYEHGFMKMYLYFQLESNIFELKHFFSFSAWFSFSYWEGCQLSLLSSCYAFLYLLFAFALILWHALCFLTGVHRQLVHSFYPSPWVRHSPHPPNALVTFLFKLLTNILVLVTLLCILS